MSSQSYSANYWWKQKGDGGEDTAVSIPPLPQPGDTCPFCHTGKLHYDGLFLLICDHCNKIAEGGCFT